VAHGVIVWDAGVVFAELGIAETKIRVLAPDTATTSV
jgi:hypothetical protein